jgi:hypothetical protein
MLRRLLLVMSVAALMAAMVAVTAVPAFATIHPLANSECANENASAVATGQNPPGISDFEESNFAQPVFSASGGNPFSPVNEPPTPAFKTPGPDIATLDAEYCPANK